MSEVTENKKRFIFKEQEYDFTKATQKWTIKIKQSDMRISNEKELSLLEASHPYLLGTATEWLEDSLVLTCKLPAGVISYEEIKQKNKSEKIRGILNVLSLKILINMPIVTIFHPENMVFDRNLIPRLAYRGLREKMAPQEVTAADFLRQGKCFALSLFTKEDFTTLYNGQLEIVKKTDFTAKISACETIEDLEAYLETVYEQTVLKETATTAVVPKVKYKVFQQVSIWMTVVAILALVPLGYYLLNKDPFQQSLLTTDQEFVQKNYDGVIATLKNTQVKKIPMLQKYEMAYAIIQGKDLTEQQKTALLNNVSLKSDEDFLDFWIQNGRGELDDSLDLAKKLEDSDLILYALHEKIEQVRNDSSLSGTKKQEEIEALETEYEKFEKKKAESLTSETATEESGTATETTTQQEDSSGKE